MNSKVERIRRRTKILNNLNTILPVLFIIIYMTWMVFLNRIKGLNGCYCGDCVKEIREMAHNGICPNCGGSMEMIGVEQGMKCDTCGFKYDVLGNPDTSEMEAGDLSDPNK